MQDAVGRAARGADAGDRVFQRLAGDDLARPDVLGEDVDHQLADFLGDRLLVVVFGRDHRRAAGADPQRLEGAGHRVGGELAAAGAGAGAGDALQLVQFLVGHVAGVVGADRLEDVEDGDVAAVPVAGGDRAAVEQHRGHVEPGQRHRAAGDRLVAGAEGDDRVELVAARHQLDRVGDHLAADQRGLHPLRPHRHPVGDGDGVELHRRAAGGAHPLFDVLGQRPQVEVAGHRLGPGVGDPDRRPAERVVVEPDPLHVGARVGAVGAVEDDRGARAGKLGRGVAVGAHRPKSTERVSSASLRGCERDRRRRPGRPRADPAQPVADRFGGELARAPRRPASGRSRARGRRPARRSGCSPSRGRRRPGCRSPGISTDLAAVVEDVDHLVAVAAGDHGGLRAQPDQRPRQLRLGRLLPQPRQRPRLGNVGRDHGGQRQQALGQRLAGLRRRAGRRPLSETITGSITTGGSSTW